MMRMPRMLMAMWVVSIASCGQASAALVDDLLAYYDFEETGAAGLANKAGSSAYDGTWSAGTFDNDAGPGFAGNAAFNPGDGLSDRSTLLVGNALNIVDLNNDFMTSPLGVADTGATMTLSMWANLAPGASNGSARFHAMETGDSGVFDLSVGTAGNYSTTGRDDYAIYGPSNQLFSSVSGFAEEEWDHHILVVTESAGNVTTQHYLNGALTGTSTPASAASFSFSSLHFGDGRTDSGDRDWDGLIDEVAVWDDALTAAEAQTVAFAGANGNALDNLNKLASVSFGGTAAAPQWAVDSFASGAGASDDLGDGGFDGPFLRTQGSGDNTLTLNFTDLDPHNVVDIGMILAQLDSLDPDRDGDRLIVNLDGVEILSVGLGYGTSVNNAFSDEIVLDVMVNGVSVPDSIILDTQTLGGANLFGDANFLEHIYDLGLLDAFQNIPHTSDTLTLEIIGRQNQSGGEFYGIDNITISTATISATLVPEPSTVFLLGLGCVLLSGRRLRRRRS